MPNKSRLPTPLGNTDAFTPRPERAVRVRARSIAADSHFEPHVHAWAQLAYCASGLVQVTASQRSGTEDAVTYIVPPSRAVWIAPGARHAITVLEAAEFRTLYLDASVTAPGWTDCRMLVVSPLLRQLISALDSPGDKPPEGDREGLLMALVLDEISRADTQALGVPMPHPRKGDKRLRALCEAVLRTPGERATLADWSGRVGASERTVARLFRQELGMTYQRWLHQARLAHALPMLAGGASVSAVAAASGYASDSAFSAMFKAAMGQAPGQFQGQRTGRG